MVSSKSISGPDFWMTRSGCGAPLIKRTGMSPRDPESDAGLLCSPLTGISWGWHCLVAEGLSKGLVLEPSLKEPDVRIRMDSGESASSLARERLLCTEEFSVRQPHRAEYSDMTICSLSIESVSNIGWIQGNPGPCKCV